MSTLLFIYCYLQIGFGLHVGTYDDTEVQYPYWAHLGICLLIWPMLIACFVGELLNEWNQKDG